MLEDLVWLIYNSRNCEPFEFIFPVNTNPAHVVVHVASSTPKISPTYPACLSFHDNQGLGEEELYSDPQSWLQELAREGLGECWWEPDFYLKNALSKSQLLTGQPGEVPAAAITLGQLTHTL